MGLACLVAIPSWTFLEEIENDLRKSEPGGKDLSQQTSAVPSDDFSRNSSLGNRVLHFITDTFWTPHQIRKTFVGLVVISFFLSSGALITSTTLLAGIGWIPKLAT